MWRPVLLGTLAIGGQVLLLRELISNFYGDEIFIGIALGGWLVWVAIGSWIGGRKRRSFAADNLFVIAGLLVPITVALVRLIPLLLTDQVGEAVSFIDATIVSLVLVGPVGLLCGALFPILSESGSNIADSTLKVYLLEGIGAFAAGVLLTLILGPVLSTLGCALWLGILTVSLTQIHRLRSRTFRFIAGVATVVLLLSVGLFQDRIDRSLDAIRYHPFTVDSSFDTHYSRQTVLSRQGTLSLITDGQVEATSPDIEHVENIIIPPLLYNLKARQLLVVGRPEFGLSDIVNSIDGIELTTIDPRGLKAGYESSGVGLESLVETDPVEFMRNHEQAVGYDIIVLPLAGLDSYRTSRLLTTQFIRATDKKLNKFGLLAIALSVDTDRYITADVERLLGSTCASVRAVFDQVILWPGNPTMIFASHELILDISYEDLISRIDSLSYEPEFIRDAYLFDRLSPSKIERLMHAVASEADIHTIQKPILPELARRIRSRAHPSDFILLDALSNRNVWLAALALLAAGLIAAAVLGRNRNRAIGRILFLVAGYLSIGLEMLVFYLFQSIVGSLYVHMAMLIGSFMLGLTVGVYFSQRHRNKSLGYMSLGLIVLSSLLILYSYDRVAVEWITLASPLLLLAIGAATGGLFVYATHLYYGRSDARTNRGAGYGWELLGSAGSAVATIGILLPMVGLHALLWGGAALAAGAILLTGITKGTS